MSYLLLKIGTIAAIAILPLAGGCGGDEAHMNHDHEELQALGEEADHEGHEHGEGIEADEHEGDEHGEHEGHDEGVVHLSREAISLAGVRIESARMRSLGRTIELPGEIGFNEDRLVHVTPRYPGVAREVHGRIGAHVKKGEVLAVLESNESLTQYSIVAPISGRIIKKHLTVGEFASEDHDMFLIADLSTVWANCEVYAKDMAHVKQGARVVITTVGGGQSAEAVLSYVAPVYSEDTRSALARAVLANNGDFWRPGTFIRASVPVEMDNARLTVEKAAVQILDGQRVVFVPGEEDGEFGIVAVETGMAGEEFVEIVSGLHQGAEYVAAGAFELKARLVTANLDAHAGHGH